MSRERATYDRPCVQSGANVNTAPRISAARIKGLGEFRGLAQLLVTPIVTTACAEQFAKPVRPADNTPNEGAAEPVAGDESDDGLSAFLAAIAAEIMGRASVACTGVAAEFAGKISAAQKTLPRDQVRGAVEALKQMKRAAVKVIRASAALEIKGRKKAATVLWRRKRLRPIKGSSQNLPQIVR